MQNKQWEKNFKKNYCTVKEIIEKTLKNVQKYLKIAKNGA